MNPEQRGRTRQRISIHVRPSNQTLDFNMSRLSRVEIPGHRRSRPRRQPVQPNATKKPSNTIQIVLEKMFSIILKALNHINTRGTRDPDPNIRIPASNKRLDGIMLLSLNYRKKKNFEWTGIPTNPYLTRFHLPSSESEYSREVEQYREYKRICWYEDISFHNSKEEFEDYIDWSVADSLHCDFLTTDSEIDTGSSESSSSNENNQAAQVNNTMSSSSVSSRDLRGARRALREKAEVWQPIWIPVSRVSV